GTKRGKRAAGCAVIAMPRPKILACQPSEPFLPGAIACGANPFGAARAERMPEARFVERRLAIKMCIEGAVRQTRLLHDGCDGAPGQPLLAKLCRCRVQNPVPGSLFAFGAYRHPGTRMMIVIRNDIV